MIFFEEQNRAAEKCQEILKAIFDVISQAVVRPHPVAQSEGKKQQQTDGDQVIGHSGKRFGTHKGHPCKKDDWDQQDVGHEWDIRFLNPIRDQSGKEGDQHEQEEVDPVGGFPKKLVKRDGCD